MRGRLKIVASGLIAVTLAVFFAYFAFSPKKLTIAVGPIGGSDIRVMVAFLQALQREGAPVRLKLLATDGAAASAEMFAKGKIDLAVLRTDVAMPDQAATVALLRRDAVYFITRPGSGIKKISDLRAKVVGAIAPRPANDQVLDRILTHYGVKASELDILRGTTAEIMQAVHEGRIDAVFVVAPASDRFGRSAFQGFPRVEGKEPELLPVSEAEAMIEQYPQLDTVDIVRGAFGGDPPRPDEDVGTLAVTHRLVARRSLNEDVVAELTRQLMSLRLGMATEAPAANDIELPSTEDRGAKFPTHPGTIAYAEGETKTFFERYGDWFYISAMILSLLGSIAAALWSRLGGRSATDEIDRDMKAIAALIRLARQAETPSELATLEKQSEDIYSALVNAMISAKPETDQVATIRFLVSELRAVIADRRQTLLMALEPQEGRPVSP